MIQRLMAFRMFHGLQGFSAALLAAMFLCLGVDPAIGEEVPFQPYVEPLPDGRIDWKEGVVYGVGKGYPHLNQGSRAKALRAAQALALQSILKVAAGVRLDDRETLESLGASGRVEIRLSALVRYEEHETSWLDEEGRSYARVTYRAPLRGVEGLTRRLVTLLRSDHSEWKRLPIQTPVPPSVPGEETPWLVVDARDLPAVDRIQPALFPQIRTREGGTVYDLGSVHEAALVERGMTRYVVLDRAHDERLSSGPVFLARLRSLFALRGAWAQDGKERKKRGSFVIASAAGAEGLKKTNLIISEDDARRIRQKDESTGILKECRVIVIVAGTVGGIEGRFPEAPNRFTKRSTASPVNDRFTQHPPGCFTKAGTL